MADLKSCARTLLASVFTASDSLKNTFRPLRAGRVAVLLALVLFSAQAFAATTTISGKVYMPNGTNVLPNVLVYVTTGAVTVPASGATCPGTAATGCLTASSLLPTVVVSGSGVYSYTYTAEDGTFTLSNVPVSTNYTLVIQSGKWMSEFTENVGTTAITGIVLGMPSSHNSGYVNAQPTNTFAPAQGNIPLIAIATGSADAAECVLRSANYGLGLNDCEFTDDAGHVPNGCSGSTGGRIHLYQGDGKPGAVISSSTPLETALIGGTSATALNSYDMLMFPCQGDSSNIETNANIDKVLDYTSAGGRVFATHYSDVWLNTSETHSGASFSGAATWSSSSTPSASGGTLESNGSGYGIGTLNTSFTGGTTLSDWLYESGYAANGTLGTANTGTDGQVEISTLRVTVASVIPPTQTWLTLNQETGSNYTGTPIMQMSFNTPVGAAEASQYGRVMFNDYHVENVSNVGGDLFPTECPTLAGDSQVAQEKMLEYALFDLSNAVTPVVVPSMTITLGSSPTTFNEGDSADSITVGLANGSTALNASTDLPITLAITLPSALTATAITETDSTGGWNCSVSTLTCTQTTGIATSASYAFTITTSVSANATAGATTASEAVGATVSSSTFSSAQTGSLTITADEHAAATWATPAAITYGTALSSTQLNAVGNAGGNATANAAGTYVYSPASGTTLSAGSNTLNVTYTPSAAYQSTYTGTGTASVTLIVNQATPAVTWPTASNISYGQALTSSTLSGGSSNGTFTWTTPSTEPGIGTAAQSVTFTPTDTTDYTTVIGSASVTVAKATPSPITWPTATGITYGQTLTSSTLSGGTSTPAGTFSWTTSSTAPGAGTAAQSVTFTPTDTTDYTTVIGSANVAVAKATPSPITWPTATGITYGQTLTSSTLSGGTSTPAGTFSWTTSSTAPGAGTAAQSVTFTPTDTTDYTTVTATVSVTAVKATAIVMLGNLTQTNTGYALAATATTNPANLTVVLVYTQNGQVVTSPTNAGSYGVTATVNDINYSGTATGTLIINPAATSVILGTSSNRALLLSTITFTATVSSTAGTPTGTVSFMDGTTLIGSGILSGGVASFPTSSLVAASHSITAVYNGGTNFVGSPSKPLPQTITDYTVSAVSGSGGSGIAQTVIPGAAATYTIAVNPTDGTTFPEIATLTVTGLPSGATATLNTTLPWTQLTSTSWQLPANTQLGNLSLTFNTPSATLNARGSEAPIRHLPLVAWGLLLLPFSGKLRRAGKRLGRMVPMLFLLVAGLAAVAGMSGCGSSVNGFFDQQQKTYNVTVTVTTGLLSRSANVTLTVQ